MSRIRYRLTLKKDATPDAEVVWEGVVWGQEQHHNSAPGGLVLVTETGENPEVDAAYKTHGLLSASWVPV